MSPADEDRRRDVLHRGELPAPHVASIGLDKEGGGVAARRQSRSVVEDAPVPAVRSVPYRIAAALRVREFLIVGRQIAVSINRSAEDDIRFAIEDRFLNGWQRMVGEGGESAVVDDMILGGEMEEIYDG